MRIQVLHRNLLPRLNRTDTPNQFTEHVVGDTDDGDVGDDVAGVAVDCVFDLWWVGRDEKGLDQVRATS
jgi:hypothetical protein